MSDWIFQGNCNTQRRKLFNILCLPGLQYIQKVGCNYNVILLLPNYPMHRSLSKYYSHLLNKLVVIIDLQ